MSSDKPRRSHGRDRDLAEYINDEPLTALAIAGAAGFILGGGASSRIGLAALAMVGKIALRGAATNFLVGLFVPDSTDRRPERARSSRSSKQHDQNDSRP
ncbi:MAG TPA: hypothetical protein VLI44_06640 [Sporolactobacillaceae bacterium]|nr:hypothetical protein [Sporolactobacillaceae bacterium]